MSGADIVIRLVRLRNDLALSVFADRHSSGTSPDRGLHMYFSASFHLEWRVKPPSGDRCSHEYTVFACNAANTYGMITRRTRLPKKSLFDVSC